MKKLIFGATLATVIGAGVASAQDIKVALIAGRTGPLEAYAKQTEAGFMLGLEYLTKGSMAVGGKKITVLVKDDQGKPDLAKSLLEQAYGTTRWRSRSAPPRPARLSPCCRSRRRTSASSSSSRRLRIRSRATSGTATSSGRRATRRRTRSRRRSPFGTGEVSIATLAQDYAFGRDGVAALKSSLAATKSPAKVVFEEYAPAERDRTSPPRRSASSTR
jgi:branched-chain amino acid transport system substrate-binding protein